MFIDAPGLVQFTQQGNSFPGANGQERLLFILKCISKVNALV